MRQPKQTPVAPATPSWRAFARWIRAVRGRQVTLAVASGIPQQSLSNYALRVSRPSERRARRIESAVREISGDSVPADGWLTKAELREEAVHLRKRSA